MLGAVTRKLNRDTGERKALFRDLVGALILNGRVETTVARAKETKKIADGLVDLALRGDLHARRQHLRPPTTQRSRRQSFAGYDKHNANHMKPRAKVTTQHEIKQH